MKAGPNLLRKRDVVAAHRGLDLAFRKDQDRTTRRNVLLVGAASPAGRAADANYFEGLRRRAGARAVD